MAMCESEQSYLEATYGLLQKMVLGLLYEKTLDSFSRLPYNNSNKMVKSARRSAEKSPETMRGRIAYVK